MNSIKFLSHSQTTPANENAEILDRPVDTDKLVKKNHWKFLPRDLLQSIALFLDGPQPLHLVSTVWNEMMNHSGYYHRVRKEFLFSDLLHRFIAPFSNLPSKIGIVQVFRRIEGIVPRGMIHPALLEKTMSQILDQELIAWFPAYHQRQFRGELRLFGTTAEKAQQIRSWLEKNQSQVSKIESLSLKNLNLKWIPPEIRYFTGLKKLHLDRNRIDDLTPLSDLKRLTELHLNHNRISDLTPLMCLKKLTSLHLSHNQISSLAELEPLEELTELDLSGNQIENIAELAALKNLISLMLESNKFTTLTPLASLKCLSFLCVDGNPISNMTEIDLLPPEVRYQTRRQLQRFPRKAIS